MESCDLSFGGSGVQHTCVICYIYCTCIVHTHIFILLLIRSGRHNKMQNENTSRSGFIIQNNDPVCKTGKKTQMCIPDFWTQRERERVG